MHTHCSRRRHRTAIMNRSLEADLRCCCRRSSTSQNSVGFGGEKKVCANGPGFDVAEQPQPHARLHLGPSSCLLTTICLIWPRATVHALIGQSTSPLNLKMAATMRYVHPGEYEARFDSRIRGKCAEKRSLSSYSHLLDYLRADFARPFDGSIPPGPLVPGSSEHTPSMIFSFRLKFLLPKNKDDQTRRNGARGKPFGDQ